MATQPSANCGKRRVSSPLEDLSHRRARLDSTSRTYSNLSAPGGIIPSLENMDKSLESATEASEPQSSKRSALQVNEYSDTGFELELAMISEMQTLENNLIASSSSTTDEQFHCDGIDDAALQTLLEESTGEIVGENPPSSVVRAFDIESRSAEDYDPDLQFSSPQASDSSGTIASSSRASYFEQTPDPRATPKPSKGLSSQSSGLMPQATWTAVAVNMRMFNPSRTCFRLTEITESKAAMMQRQPHAVYNVFARVLYSSRENFFRRQYFQLRDLLSESPPYLTGALLG
ncbi:hypothetical protein MANI_115126 [Metarhizium anisopliae]|nr:hypothetical protein MANI_115126 [Metarhizium anisopliae]